VRREERGKRKEERGKRKEERGKRKEEREVYLFALHALICLCGLSFLFATFASTLLTGSYLFSGRMRCRSATS
jgi:hypothetical protein